LTIIESLDEVASEYKIDPQIILNEWSFAFFSLIQSLINRRREREMRAMRMAAQGHEHPTQSRLMTMFAQDGGEAA